MGLNKKFEETNLQGDARILNLLQSNFGVGSKGIVGLFGDLLVAKRTPLFSANFSYPANTKTIILNNINSGSVDYNVNLLRVSTGTTTGSKGSVRTKRNLRYTAGRDAEGMFTAIFSQGVVGIVQRIGLFNDNDGFFIGFKDDIFSVTRRKNGDADEIIGQEDFNGDTLDGNGNSKYVYNPTMINIFRITYGYLGTAEIKYQIQVSINNVTQWLTFHTIDRRNKFAATSIVSPYLPLSMEVENGATTENVVLQTGSIYAGVFDGSLDDRAARFFSANANKVGITGINQRLVVFHNKPTFRSVDNLIEAILVYFTAGVESNKPVTINIYKLPDQTTATGAWTNVDTNNSTFEYSLDTTLDLTNAELMVSFALGKSTNVQAHLSDLFVNLLPDEYAGITIDNATGGTSDVNITFRWKELF